MGIRSKIDILHVSPGYFCNLSCAHCTNSSGPTRSKGMRVDELEGVKQAVRDLAPSTLLFTGGEPTLHIALINEVIAAHPSTDQVRVTITTNGWYSRFPQKMAKILSSFKKLDAVQLSYDRWHEPSLSKENICGLADHCKALNIEFAIQAVYASASDLIALCELQEGTDLSMTIQAVETVGRAKENGIVADSVGFVPEHLDQRCPNIGSLTFAPNLGFSVCCANLLFGNRGPDFASKSPDLHISSDFYNEITSKTLREQAARRGISIAEIMASKDVRSICSACEFIHCNKPAKHAGGAS